MARGWHGRQERRWFILVVTARSLTRGPGSSSVTERVVERYRKGAAPAYLGSDVDYANGCLGIRTYGSLCFLIEDR
jgi:hypothetical protein